MQVGRNKKPRRVKGTKGNAKGVATTRSTAGPGFNFEDQVGAWLLTKMLCGEPIPGIDASGSQLQTQTHALGWDIDDLLATGTTDSGVLRYLALSCKSSVQVTSSGLPSDFISAAWRQWRKDGPMRQRSDCLALVTRGHNSTFDAVWSDIKNWCADGDAALALGRIKSSTKHKKVFTSIKAPAKAEVGSVADEEVVALVRRLQVFPLDFQLAHSDTEKNSITLCRGILRSRGLKEARELWKAIVKYAEDTRLGSGTIRLSDLWRELRKSFHLKDHPDFASSWDALGGITKDHKSVIENSLPSGFQIRQADHVQQIAKSIESEAVTIVYGDSGTGKSALIKSVLDDSFATWVQVWMGPEELDTALSEANRTRIGLQYPMVEVLKGGGHAANVLVIDSAERLTAECFSRAKPLVAELIAENAVEATYRWRVVIVGQTEAWASNRLQELAGILRPSHLEMRGAAPEEVRAALQSTKTLSWLSFYDDTVAALTNLRTLAWVMEADAIFQQGHQAISHTAIADQLWAYWTNGKISLQSLLMRLAEREASFERSFALSAMETADTTVLESAPTQLPLRINARNRLEFRHDLAADWARFQRLKEIAHDTKAWAVRAENPLWNQALRMLGQFLLREPAGSRTAWDEAFESVEKAGNESPLAVDVLLDALCLDPLAEVFLHERADLLLEDHGARLNRLLRRFQHIATVVGVPSGLPAVDPTTRFYLEAHYRAPILGRWPAVARFLALHRERVAELISPVVAKVCETWLTTTPLEIVPGLTMPFRREFAQIALASARALQIAQGKRVIFLDQSEAAIYSAALAAASDLPDEVAEWALEVSERREPREDVVQAIASFHRQEAEKRKKRLQSDPIYRLKEEQRRASIPVFIPSSTPLPPWPLGGKNRIEREFRRCCTHSRGLVQLIKVRPLIAAEVLLAAIIEDSPEESYSSHSILNIDLGLEFDNESYPTAYWKSAFHLFFEIDPEVALTTLIQLVEFATERWVKAHGKRGASGVAGIAITLADGTDRRFVGNHMVFDWPQENSPGSGQLNCALAALERWLCTMLDRGENISPLVDGILRRSSSVSLLGLLVNVGKYRHELFSESLRPLLGSFDAYIWDDYRVNQALPYHFDDFTWIRAGETIFEMARQWTLAPYRKVTLLGLAIERLCRDERVAVFLQDAVQKWQPLPDGKEGLETRILIAQLDRRNYRVSQGESPIEIRAEFQCPPSLLREVAEYESGTLPAMQLLLLPSRCEQLLVSSGSLTAEQAGAVASALNAAQSAEKSDENVKHLASVAAACVLVAKAPDWLTLNPNIRQQAQEIVRGVVASIGETVDALDHPLPIERAGTLRFAAHAVAWQLIDTSTEATDHAVLRIVTSGDRQATAALLQVAYTNRTRLGPKWWRLLHLAVLWSGLAILAPRFDDPPQIGVNWTRWLRWLRGRRLDYGSPNSDVIDPLSIACRIERLQRARWRRAQAREKRRSRRPLKARHSSGLDTGALRSVFFWLLQDAPVSQEHQHPSDDEIERKLVIALWRFEAWRKYEDIGDDGEHGTPSTFGYDVLSALARLVLSAPPEKALDLWKPVFSLGPDAHYSIGHFIASWFGLLSAKCDAAVFGRHWREMLQFSLDATSWSSGRRWYYGQQLLRQLLGFGSTQTIVGKAEFRSLVSGMRDLYEVWALQHLPKDEDNVAGFCGFLAEEAGSPLRIDGLLWLASVIRSDVPAARWHRERTGNSMMELLHVVLMEDADTLSRNSTAREAIVGLAAVLVARQVPASLALQERIQRIR